jgi:hypothetical protein
MNPNLIIIVGGTAGYLIACIIFEKQLPVLSIEAIIGIMLGSAASVGLMYFASYKGTKHLPETQLNQVDSGITQLEKTEIDKEKLEKEEVTMLAELLKKTANGDTNAALEIYENNLKKNNTRKIYIITKYLKDTDRRRIFRVFAGAPTEYRENMVVVAKKAASDSKRVGISGIVILLLFVLLSLQAITSFTIGIVLSAIICLFIGIICLINSNIGMRIANEAITIITKYS